MQATTGLAIATHQCGQAIPNLLAASNAWRVGMTRCRDPLPSAHRSLHHVMRVQPMQQSHVIDIDGRFIGVALRLEQGFRFIAIDPRVEDLGETLWPRLEDIQRLARRMLAQETGAGSNGQCPADQVSRSSPH